MFESDLHACTHIGNGIYKLLSIWPQLVLQVFRFIWQRHSDSQSFRGKRCELEVESMFTASAYTLPSNSLTCFLCRQQANGCIRAFSKPGSLIHDHEYRSHLFSFKNTIRVFSLNNISAGSATFPTSQLSTFCPKDFIVSYCPPSLCSTSLCRVRQTQGKGQLVEDFQVSFRLVVVSSPWFFLQWESGAKNKRGLGQLLCCTPPAKVHLLQSTEGPARAAFLFST